MECGSRSVFIAICLVHLLIKNNVSCQKTDELREMRSMLRSALEQNRKLEQQNNRLKLIWAGLQQMCSALQMSPCDCGSASSNETDETKINKTYTSTVETPVQTVRVLSVTSEGLVDNRVGVSVNYIAPPEHSSDWIILRMNDGMMSTSGNRTSKLSDVNGTQFIEYKASITIDHYNMSRLVLVRVYSETKSLSLKFNLTALEEPDTQIIPDADCNLVKFNESYQVQKDTDLNITIPFDGDKMNRHSGGDMYFTGLNTSVNPSTVFEVLPFNNDGLDFSLSGQNKSSVLRITLRYSIAQYGGILTFRPPYQIRFDGFVKELSIGDLVNILSPQTNTVVAPNSFGLHTLSKQTIVRPPSQSITCFAIGNPRPEVYILKKSHNGSLKELPSETVGMDSLSIIAVHNVYTHNKKQSNGKYICRAVSGNKTVEVMTEVVIAEPIKFDELQTGVIKNTTKKIVIACRASGRPRPVLQMRLRDKYGPDLLKYGVYKVSETEPNQTTSRVTLTIPANETRINTVYCAAMESQQNRGAEELKKIEVYPGMEDNWDWDNWEFYSIVSEKVNSMYLR